ncbi:MAG: alanine racemase [Leptolyngbyaceae cyanobacterium SL_1_1]|nr:alanine racemase [Leptolyngbyaceae cyanobacterium RM1_1_2]NJO08748.1 alanine racemase [Leptolyngbyaceae cyanobacterium SL_1_1]
MLSWETSSSIASMRHCRAWVEINLGALKHNVEQLRASLGAKTDLMAVVKADAYGHGAVTVAKTAVQAGASWLGVATVPEGIELRQANLKAPILVMGAVNTPEEVRVMAQWQLQPTVVTPKQALIFSDILAGDWQGRSPLPVHLKLDTGMSRLGHPWQQAAAFYQFVRRLPQLKISSIYSHLATADEPDPTFMQTQQQRFETAIAELQLQGFQPPRLHLANSAAMLADSSLHYDLVRVGLALYGLYPAPHLNKAVSLRPVMQVKARITHLKQIEPGTGVSYGHQFIADRLMRIAVVGIGYADGVPRLLSNRLTALIRGQRVQQIGTITMDQLMLDVTHLPNLQEGDIVTLLGRDRQGQITAEDWANMLGTISWEILCGFKHRLPRILVESACEIEQV